MTTSPPRDGPGVADDGVVDVPCSIIRGGTSKGVYFRAEDLPEAGPARDRLVLAVMGSPDRRQVDGLGGADTLTSKVAVVGPADDPAFDVSYTFGQVSIDEPVVDYNGNCGNISSGVGYFAIRTGMVDPVDPVTRVDVRHTTSGVHMFNEVPTPGGTPRVTGDFSINGVPGTGARVTVGFVEPGGERTGDVLPTGSPRDTLALGDRTVPCSLVDAGNPCLFLRAADFGLDGTELPADVDGDDALLSAVERARRRMAVRAGLSPDEATAAERDTLLPLVVFVAEPRDYVAYTGEAVDAGDCSLLARMVFNRRLHKAYAGTGAICTGVASRIDGTLVSEVVRPLEVGDGRTRVTVGHPSGTMDAAVETDADGSVTEAVFARTARPLMDGTARAVPEQVPDPRVE